MILDTILLTICSIFFFFLFVYGGLKIGDIVRRGGVIKIIFVAIAWGLCVPLGWYITYYFTRLL